VEVKEEKVEKQDYADELEQVKQMLEQRKRELAQKTEQPGKKQYLSNITIVYSTHGGDLPMF
jgi:hypothetical protein